jgi:hypothetical protein
LNLRFVLAPQVLWMEAATHTSVLEQAQLGGNPLWAWSKLLLLQEGETLDFSFPPGTPDPRLKAVTAAAGVGTAAAAVQSVGGSSGRVAAGGAGEGGDALALRKAPLVLPWELSVENTRRPGGGGRGGAGQNAPAAAANAGVAGKLKDPRKLPGAAGGAERVGVVLQLPEFAWEHDELYKEVHILASSLQQQGQQQSEPDNYNHNQQAHHQQQQQQRQRSDAGKQQQGSTGGGAGRGYGAYCGNGLGAYGAAPVMTHPEEGRYRVQEVDGRKRGERLSGKSYSIEELRGLAGEGRIPWGVVVQRDEDNLSLFLTKVRGWQCSIVVAHDCGQWGGDHLERV